MIRACPWSMCSITRDSVPVVRKGQRRGKCGCLPLVDQDTAYEQRVTGVGKSTQNEGVDGNQRQRGYQQGEIEMVFEERRGGLVLLSILQVQQI